MTDSPDYLVQIVYFLSAFLFILGLKRMNSPNTAQKGLILAGIGMLLAVVITYFNHEVKSNYLWMTVALFIGGTLAYISARKTDNTAAPKMIALYNGLGGGAAAAIAAVILLKLETQSESITNTSKYLAVAGALIGSISFSGSLVAFAKLHGLIKNNIRLPMHQWANALLLVVAITFGIAIVLNGSQFEISTLIIFFILALIFGVLMIIPMDNRDMPVTIALLNSLTGIAVGFEGFVLNNPIMMIAGFLVAAAGLKLTSSIGKATNSPLLKLLFGGSDDEDSSTDSFETVINNKVKELQPNDAAMMMAYAKNIIIVPGYGMAVAQAQHKVGEMSKLLKDNGVNVKFAIHPIAGRMPGHMNTLLTQAGISNNSIFDLDEINTEFDNADVVLIVGANDTTNTSARSDQSSPLFGMPILNADKAKNVIVIKRDKGTGYSNIDNPLFYKENTGILYGDALSVLSKVIHDLKEI